MSTEPLYFNGINGATGTYGLRPMSGEELAEHIRGGTGGESRERKELERQLTRDSARKISAIVGLLAESNFEKAERDDTWESDWLSKLAGLLARELLGEEYTKPGQLKRLEARLRPYPKDQIIVDIVKLLAENRTSDLAAILLEDQDEEPDNSGELKEQLKRDAVSLLDDVQRSLLAKGRAGDLEGDVKAQSEWLEALITGLQLVPIKALNALMSPRVRPLQPLIEELDALANATTPPSPWLEPLRQDLTALPRTVSWNELLQKLQMGLQGRIADQQDPVAWNNLFDALDKWLSALRRKSGDVSGVIEGVDPTDLVQAGWGIIFPYEDPRQPSVVARIEEKLGPLLELRRSQAGEHFKIYKGGDGYHPNDTANKFLGRYGATASRPADPEKVPYYILIVGSPEEIPFHFQYQLDVQYAVGRIDFDDDLEAYANYARSVVAAETKVATSPSNIAFFGVSNPDDRATQLSADHLVQPLYERINKRYGAQWQVGAVLRDEATKARLKRLLGGDETPALLFAACHGMEFAKDDRQGRQVPYQGALLCQDWRGPEAGRGEVPRDCYLAGEDLEREADDLQGLIAFFFACYGAGTPRFDEYSKQAFKERGETIAERPFVAALPKAMLGLPKGALAVVGHVERAWGTSYLGPRNSEQIAVFASAVERLLKGHPVGWAMEYFDGRYAALSTELTDAIETQELYGKSIDPYELAEMWTANNDARGYIVIGDPAVRLNVT